MATYYVSEGKLVELLKGSGGICIFAPSLTGELTWLDLAESAPSLSALVKPRPAQSAKGLFMAPTESVGRYGSSPQSPTAVVDTQTALVLGIRACELRALNYLDKVMLGGEFEDPSYRARREGMMLISCDCVDCTESCFCPLVGGQPYATEGFDINLTPIEGGFVAEAATEKGQNLLGISAQSPCAEATKEQLARREETRHNMIERLKEQNAKFAVETSDEKKAKLPSDGQTDWQQFSADCVECAACTNICPTCHCFYLYDQLLGAEDFERVRAWDSCLLSTYHRMAGGVNMKLTPRPYLSSRLANRVLHKFVYSHDQYSLLGCVGCGRCIDACLGAIDIRQVVGELSK